MTHKTPRPMGAPKKKVLKARQNISISPSVLKTAQKLAFKDSMSLSAWIEQLVKTKIEEGKA